MAKKKSEKGLDETKSECHQTTADKRQSKSLLAILEEFEDAELSEMPLVHAQRLLMLWLYFTGLEKNNKAMEKREFDDAFHTLIERLEIEDPFGRPSEERRDLKWAETHFWFQLACKLLPLAKEFQEPKEQKGQGRPKLGKYDGGTDYQRYVAVKKFQRKNPEFANRFTSDVIRALQRREDPLFKGYDVRVLQSAVARGKKIWEEARKKAEAIQKKANEIENKMK